MQDSDSPAPRRKRRVSEQTPVQRALGLLVRREHSRKELTRKLQARGIETEAAVAAVDTLSEAGWQDDTRFAENLVRIRANTGYGPIHIRAELGTHGLDSEQIALAMDTFEGDWAENAGIWSAVVSARPAPRSCRNVVKRPICWPGAGSTATPFGAPPATTLTTERPGPDTLCGFGGPAATPGHWG